MLKAPHSLRQINDVLIIVAVCGAPLGSANVRVGRNCVRECVFAARTQAMWRQRRVAGLDTWRWDGVGVWEQQGCSRAFKTSFFFYLNQWGIARSGSVQPLALCSPCSQQPNFHHSGQQAKNKDLKQSTKGPPVQLVWCPRCGRSFVLSCPGCEVPECQQHSEWKRGIINPSAPSTHTADSYTTSG